MKKKIEKEKENEDKKEERVFLERERMFLENLPSAPIGPIYTLMRTSSFALNILEQPLLLLSQRTQSSAEGFHPLADQQLK